MNEELKEITEMQKQLDAMVRSCADFNKTLKEKQDNFLVNQLGFKKEDANINLFEIVKRVSEKRIIV